MIEVVTGLPGASKTLHTLARVKQWSEKDNRPVFYAGIKDLMLPWTEIDPLKWFECPPGSIIVIDECQTIFRPRSFGSNTPDFVAKLETHRHQGLDIVLITQHPLLIDTNIRRLAGKHLHIVRKFGTQASTIHEWASIRETCDKPAGRVDSIKHHWKFDKEAFNYYKSAEVHTVKRNIPMKVWILILMPFIIAGIGWKFYSNQMDKLNGTKPQESQQNPAHSSSAVPDTPKLSYAEAHTPAIAGFPFTAPIYEELTKPKRAPYPAACVVMKFDCRCYTQDGTRIPDVPMPTCQSIVDHGFFVDWIDPNQKDDYFNKQDRSGELVQAPKAVSMVGADQEPQGSFAALGYTPEPRMQPSAPAK